jgi:hypothetical protein
MPDLRERALRAWLRRPQLVIRSQVWFVLAGVVLLLAGIACLALSYRSTSQWWQGTLDAFGVGFTVGGIVDVLTIFLLNQSIVIDEQRTQENNELARQILQSEETDAEALGTAADNLLRHSRGLMDRTLDGQLRSLVITWRVKMLHENFRLRAEAKREKLRLAEEGGKTPGHDHGDPPQAPISQ